MSFNAWNRPDMNIDTMLKNAEIDGAMRTHLTNVYGALSMTLLSAFVGAYVDMTYRVGGLLTTIALFGTLLYLAAQRTGGKSSPQAVGGMLVFGFLKGVSLGPLISRAAEVDPALIVTALLGTTTVFVCFSLSAMFAKRMSMLALGGVLSTTLMYMCIASLFNLFFRSEMVFVASLYVGLMVFCGYVLYDTQMIMERFRLGDRDFVWHSIDLFIDFVAIFVRILIILMRNSEKKRDDRRRR